MNFSRIACALALVASSAAHAAPVTFQFTGTLDGSEIAGYDVGSLVSGQFTYDTDVAPAAPAESLGDGFQVVTYGLNAPDSFVLNIGGDAVSFSGLNMVILDSSGEVEGGEALSIMADGMSINGVAGTGAVSMTFLTMGSNPDVMTTALPLSINLADFDVPMAPPAGTFFTDLTSNAKTANFTINTLTAVPEPGTALTMLLGFGLMGGLLSRRRAAAR